MCAACPYCSTPDCFFPPKQKAKAACSHTPLSLPLIPSDNLAGYSIGRLPAMPCFASLRVGLQVLLERRKLRFQFVHFGAELFDFRRFLL